MNEYSDSRYEDAKLISKSIIDFLDKMDSELRRKFLSFLCYSNFTIVFEILIPNSQHIVDLSNFKEPFLRFITFTQNKVCDKPQTLCPMPPDCAIQVT